MILSPAIPVLRSFSEEKAREFYLGFMGFRVNWEHYGDAAPGAVIFIRIDDIAALHAELNAKQFRYARPMIVQQDWGQVMQIDDPFGNRLRFCQS